MARRTGRARAERRVGTWPHASQFAKEGSYGHRTPAGQILEGLLELMRVHDDFAERGKPLAVPIGMSDPPPRIAKSIGACSQGRVASAGDDRVNQLVHVRGCDHYSTVVLNG